MRLINRTKGAIRPLVLALAIGVTPAAAVATASNAVAAPYCGIVWGSLAKHNSHTTSAPIGNVRAGRHTCFDRMVIDIKGKGAGYNVRYVSQLVGSAGVPIPLRGGAKLQVSVLAPTYNVNTGAPVYDPPNPSEAVNVTGFTTFRQIKYVESFEGVTQFGLGTRARLPFRVFTLDGPGTGSRLVIDVAHRW